MGGPLGHSRIVGVRQGYFDHNATTPLDPRVRAAMEPWLGSRWGNPASAHRWGQEALAAVEAAREEVAALLGVSQPRELIFCASGTEALNTVIFSELSRAPAGSEVVLSGLEHPAVRQPFRSPWLAAFRAVEVPAPGGVVEPEAMLQAISPRTVLVALQLANHELGTIQPVAAVAAGCRSRGVPLLVDAAQAVGKIPVDVSGLGADYLVVAAHKFHGPLGAAALWVHPARKLEPLLWGGGQERGLRASTLNVPALVGFGEAARLARLELDGRSRKLWELRDRFEEELLRRVPFAWVHARQAPRLPHVSSVAFPGIDRREVAIRLDLEGFAVSTGPACASGRVEPSPGLLAAGIPAPLAASTVRFSFGWTNEWPEIEELLTRLPRVLESLQAPMGVGR